MEVVSVTITVQYVLTACLSSMRQQCIPTVKTDFPSEILAPMFTIPGWFTLYFGIINGDR
jgi:hypothetical protein